MTKEELHNDLKQLSGYVYSNGSFEKPADWQHIESQPGKKTGFYAETFSKGKNIVIAIRGTEIGLNIESAKDIASDAFMLGTLPPVQIVSAQSYYEKIKREFPNHNIILTGHSLGGSLAQILGSEYGEETVTFNAFGTANLLNYQIKNTDNITNYGNVNDFTFTANLRNQIGNTYVISDNGNNNSRSNTIKPNENLSLKKYHSLENMGDLSKAVKYQGEYKPTEEQLKIKAGIEKTIDYKDIDPDRILTEEEIAQMSDEEFLQNEEYINKQINDGKIMSKVQADKQVQSGNLVWVDDYVRDDGTQVSGYYRRKALAY